MALGKAFRQRASGFQKPDERDVYRIQQIDFSDSEHVKRNLNGFRCTIEATAHSGFGRRVRFEITLDKKNPTVTP